MSDLMSKISEDEKGWETFCRTAGIKTGADVYSSEAYSYRDGYTKGYRDSVLTAYVRLEQKKRAMKSDISQLEKDFDSLVELNKKFY